MLYGRFHLPDIRDYLVERHHVVIPLNQRFVAHVDRDDNVIELFRERYATLHFGDILQRIGGQFVVRDRLVQPRASLVVADFRAEPYSEQHFHRELMFANEFQGGERVLSGIVKPDQVKAAGQHDLQILEDLGVARIHGPVASIRMLAFTKTRVCERHDLANQQVIGGLFERFSRSRCCRVVSRR